jgi:hypothetical protein
MKTQQPFLALLLTFQLLASFAKASPVEPVRILGIPGAGLMIMDGEDSETEYTDEQNTAIFNAAGFTGGDADFKADFKLCWDLNYLYIWANISDDVEEDYNWGAGNPWEFDNVEVFLQLDTNTVNTTYSATTVQLRFCRGLDSVQEPGHARRADFLYYCNNTSIGWVVEAGIPWTAAFQDGILPEDYLSHLCIIGFDFAGADSDDSDSDPTVGNRDCQSAWDSDDPDTPDDRTEDNAWNNTSVFGYLFTFLCGDQLPSSFEKGFSVYPNPAHDMIELKNIQPESDIDIYNMMGLHVTKTHFTYSDFRTTIDISELRNGMYIALINRKETVRFVKE